MTEYVVLTVETTALGMLLKLLFELYHLIITKIVP